MLRLASLAVLLALPTSAFADKAAADGCAAGLSKESKVIYDTAAPLITPKAAIRDVLTQQVRGLVISGKVQQASARDSATSAGACLQKLQ